MEDGAGCLHEHYRRLFVRKSPFAREVTVDDQLKQFLCELYSQLKARARQLWRDGIVTTSHSAVHCSARVYERALTIIGSYLVA